MIIEHHHDHRGAFCLVICDDGARFAIDTDDIAALGVSRWYVFASRSQRCKYVAKRENDRTTLLHRLLMDAPKGLTVDHEDGNGLNDRRYNLRLCTYGENRFNSHHPKRSATGYRGVYLTNDGRFKVMISLSTKKTYLGTFDDPIEAARVFDAAAFAHRGRFTQLNFPAALT